MRVTIFFTVMLLIAIGSALAQPQPPDTVWTHTYGGVNFDQGRSVYQTADGGYVITGQTSSYGAGNYDVYLVKTDSLGAQQWYRTFGGSNFDHGYCVRQTNDLGYIIVGRTESFGAGSEDVYLIKTDSWGNQQWYRTFGGTNNDEGYSVQQTNDGGYIIAGYTCTYGAGTYDVYLLKTDSLGNQQWYRTFGDVGEDKGRSIRQTADGGYIIAGYKTVVGTGFTDVYVIKTDSLGNQLWSRTYSNNDFDEGNCIQITNDGGYLIAGFTYSYVIGYYDAYLIKTDSLGNQQWSQTYGGNNDDKAYSVQLTEDGYILAGSTHSYGAGSSDVFIVRTDLDGNQYGYSTYGGIDQDIGYEINNCIEGGFILTGYTLANGSYEMYLLRLESELPLYYYSIYLTPINTPIQIPAGGGPFRFDLNITNYYEENWIFDFWTKIIKPNGQIREPHLLATFLFLEPDEQIIVNGLAQCVPNYAPPGEYIYIGCVGTYPNTIVSSDTFLFTKLPGNDAPNHNLGWALLGWDEPADNTFRLSPLAFSLAPASPNPFNSSVVLRFELSDARGVELLIYDISGREVWRLASGISHLGTNEVVWDAEGMPSGIYFARLSAVSCQLSASGSQSMVQKLLLLK